ncbi:MAG TPA: hypothetical protein VFA69_10450 [Candidatus Nitrosotalea sp.]|nr:hypothetical protein [Candidatus Nitrosotalea sp.]
MNLPTYRCRCDKPKKHRIILDGGSSGHYMLELCASCYRKEDEQFVIKEEEIINE